jgi:hypothetical protein
MSAARIVAGETGDRAGLVVVDAGDGGTTSFILSVTGTVVTPVMDIELSGATTDRTVL